MTDNVDKGSSGAASSSTTSAEGRIEDFTNEDISPQLPEVTAIPYNAARARERVRGTIAIILLIAIIVLSLFPYVPVFTKVTASELNTTWYGVLLEAIDKNVTALVAVFATITGFYFGSVESSKS